MKINLLVDYRGVLTEERYYKAGEYEAGIDMPEGFASSLVLDGRAEEIKPEPKPNPKRAPRKRTTTTRKKTTDSWDISE